MSKQLWVLVFAVQFTAAAFGFSRDAILEEMEPGIAACVARKDTNNPVFHGCWDWHSSVHGHWALFRIANALGRSSAFTRQAEASLSPTALELEEKRVAHDIKFENPYGRAWFLRLAIDFERWADKERVPLPARLRSLADLIASSIRAHFRRNPVSPSSFEYQNAAWAFYQLHAYYDFIGDTRARAEVEAVVDGAFVTSAEQLSFVEPKIGFFSLFGNWAFLVVKTRPAPIVHAFLAAHSVRPRELGVYPVTTSHSLGLTWSRAWAFSALLRFEEDPAVRQALAAALERHVEQGMKNHARYQRDYRSYGHWIPQFAVYALTENLD